MGEQRVRIVGGRWRGRRIQAPKGIETRPTSDRVREGLFDALGALLGTDLGGPVVLDVFAGSGALGLEALSRGAQRAVMIEHDPAALRALKANIDSLGAGEAAVVVHGDAFAAGLRRAVPSGPFALITLDPPYRIEQARLAALLEELVQAGAVADGAIVAIEHSTSQSPASPAGYVTLRTYRYGDTSMTLLQASAEGSNTEP
jgi:16S rRNA (guanine(966)-N(2))-methyltransferase RsmD